MSEHALVLDRVTKKYGDVVAVRELSLSIERGEMFGLIGPDGAGKTTTIRLMCGLLKVDAGTLRVLGRDPVKDHAHVTQSIGYLSQRSSLYGDLSVDENIAFFAEIHGLHMNDQTMKARRTRLLDLTQLAPFRDRLADQLSGGMKQKLALACTLVHEPQVILLDEPVNGSLSVHDGHGLPRVLAPDALGEIVLLSHLLPQRFVGSATPTSGVSPYLIIFHASPKGQRL